MNDAQLDDAVLEQAKELATKFIAAAEKRIKKIIENMPAGLAIISDFGLIESVSPEFERLTGELATSVTGRDINEVLLSSSGLSVAERLKSCCGNGIFTAQLRSATGELVQVELTAAKLSTPDGERLMLCILDATLPHQVL